MPPDRQARVGRLDLLHAVHPCNVSRFALALLNPPIDQVPVRFWRGAADDPTDRILKRQQVEAQQLSLALGEADDDGLLFRFAVETGDRGQVERVVFLALRDEDRVECFWPVPMELSAMPAANGAPAQLRLMGEEVPVLKRNNAGLPAPRLRRAR